MRTLTKRSVFAVLGIAVLTAGCAHVSQDDLDGRLADLRQDMTEEMESRDQEVRGDLNQRVDGVEARLDALEQDLQQLEEDFGVTVERLETALRFNVPVHFQFDKANLTQRATEILDRFAMVTREYYPQALLTVEGFTDPSGSAEYNLRLGQRRANAVKGYLVDKRGISADRIRAVSYGEDTSRLVAEGATGPGSEGWENRRVVVVIDHNGQGPSPAVIAEDSTEGSEG